MKRDVAANQEICYNPAMQGDAPAPLRRVEALAYIVERISRSGIAPSYGEIGRAMRPAVHRSRAAQFVEQLVREGYLERSPASRRGIAIRDVVRCRSAIEQALGLLGYKHAPPLGVLQVTPSTFGYLPKIPPFEHIPDID
ncbi:hypothetical protein [Sphingomonas sp. BAUL-RG-20F-R05-02]|uniref:LexA family protein n=1 Tax=Sphingomonas sp. BAUL-RG-20F-R05-02 TaxID=2914830 RepID=UPI001F5A28EF|nr:hypothetical protein [Sphingomonas sp. BAUL-RG-20F-R05-02]